MLKNKCYKMLKRNTYILTDTLPDLPDTPSTIDEERLHTLWKYKERLPARIKEVFDLYYEKGYTRNEIAEITNTPLPTLKKLFNKGHKRLKKQMIEHDNNNKPSSTGLPTATRYSMPPPAVPQRFAANGRQ